MLYHQIAELHSDPWSLSVTPGHFAEHLEVLRQYAHPLSLQQLSQGLLDGDIPDRSVSVTFDDGYANNLHNAKPLLERYEIPATFFLTTGYIGHEREFWWDELDRLLLQPGTVPEMLRLSVNGRLYQWELGKAAHYSEDAAQHHWRAWKGPFRSRYRLYFSLWELLNSLTEDERNNTLDELRIWADAKPTVRQTHRTLSSEEVVDLAQGELAEVGAHTVTHPALSKLSVTSQWNQILGSKVWLEKTLGHQVNGFSYPGGDLSAETVDIVREAGFACACCSKSSSIGRSVDRFQLPRVEVGDWNGKKFASWLSRWLHGREG